MEKNLLKIENLHSSIDNTSILKGVNLLIKSGEIHAIMGKNGSGKSTLAKVIAGHPSYEISKGRILFRGDDITNICPEERSHKGIFLAFQYPIEIPGVSNIDFLRMSYNARQKVHNQPELDPVLFFELIHNNLKMIDMDASFLTRNVNEGFSGGEKKKNEMLQMNLLKSKLCIFDEIDSGLDIDALKNVTKNINQIHDTDNAILIITHYQRILQYVVPNYIHIMDKGKIIYTGDASTAQKLEQYGYKDITNLK